MGELTGRGFPVVGMAAALQTPGVASFVFPHKPGTAAWRKDTGQDSVWAASFPEKGHYLRKQAIWNSVGNTSLIICHSTAGFPKPRSRKKKPELSPG